MRLPLRLIAFLGASVSGTTIGYAIADRPPPAIVLTETQPAVQQSESVAPSPAVVPDGPPDDAWTLQTEAAAFDDLTNVYLSVPSDGPLACGPRRRASLLLRCLEDRTAVYIAHDCATPQIDDDGWEVELRLDQGPVETAGLAVDSRGEAFGHWEYQAARVFIERLLDARTLHVRFAEAGGLVSEMTFPIANLDRHIDALSEACSWSKVPPWEMGPHPTAVETDISVNATGVGSGTATDGAPASPQAPPR